MTAGKNEQDVGGCIIILIAYVTSLEDLPASNDIDFLVNAVASEPILVSSGDTEVETRQRASQVEQPLEELRFL